MRLIISILAILLTTTISARELYNLNENWRMFPASKSSGDDAHSISLPHCWGQDPSTPPSLTNANYLRSIYAPEAWREQRVFLRFYGVQSIADLFVNGKHVGEHRGGSTAFTFEISQFLNIGDDNTIVVRVSSTEQNDILPTSIEHLKYGGIYRDVEMIVTPKVAISPIFYGSDGVFVTTSSVDGNRVEGDVAVKILSDSDTERLVELSFSDMSGEICFSTRLNKHKIERDGIVKIPFSTKKITAWSPENPTLYNVSVRITPLETISKELPGELSSVTSAAPQYDEVSVVTGFRTIALPEKGAENGALLINGESHLLRGVSLYHDHPKSGSVMGGDLLSSDLDMVYDMGANAIRSAIAPHDRSLYSLCDQQGIAVWIDTPLSRSSFFSDVAYYPTQRFEENGVQQLREVIYQNYNHPSVMMWGIFSLLSTRGDSALEYVQRLNSLSKSIDVTRPTVALSNQNGKINEVTDLIVWQQNIGWDKGELSDINLWQNLIHNRWAYLRSGVMFGEKGSVNHQITRSEIPMSRLNKRNGWYPEVRQCEMHEEYMKHLSTDTKFWGIWSTSMFDYKAPRSTIGENPTGHISSDRATKKDSYYLYRALWNREQPTLHITDRGSRLCKDNLVTLRVYASQDEAPIAIINGEEREMQNTAPAQFILDSIVVNDRTNIVVQQGNMTDSTEFIYGSPLRAREH